MAAIALWTDELDAGSPELEQAGPGIYPRGIEAAVRKRDQTLVIAAIGPSVSNRWSRRRVLMVISGGVGAGDFRGDLDVWKESYAAVQGGGEVVCVAIVPGLVSRILPG